MPPCAPASRSPRLRARLLAGLGLTLALAAPAPAGDGPQPAATPLAGFDLPDEWEAKFWADPDAKALLALEPEAVAKLVPKQAGLRFCACPACDAPESGEPLAWSVRKPDVVTCLRCNASFPNDKFPAKVDNKVPVETVPTGPNATQSFPYHKLSDDGQRFPNERLYLEARRDFEAREFLSKAALYAACRHRDPAFADRPDPRLARLAAVLLVRFAQVYPGYALHLDQPGQPKFLEPPRREPPFRRGYRTGKWTWTGSLDVPLNLVIAHAMIRDDPAAYAGAGRLLKDPDPIRTVERDLFRASARFTLDQPEEDDQRSLQVDRGVLAVGRVLKDPALVAEATARLNRFARRGFFHDGLWREGDTRAHREVLGLLDGWIDRLLADAPGTATPARPLADAVPMLALAREAGSRARTTPADPGVVAASWPAATPEETARGPALLGGAGLAHLAVGQGDDALDLELRGMGNYGSPRSRRQALRLAVGGRVVLGDLDELPPRRDGWDLASASHNTVLVDALNQRETAAGLREPAAGGDWLFFAADADFQVAVLDDARAYPKSASRFRQTVVVASGPRGRYAVSVFEVRGGHQHDQVFHGAAGSASAWETATPLRPGPETLLPAGVRYEPSTTPGDGRWAVQGLAEFVDLARAPLTGATTATLAESDGPGVRLHLLGDGAATLVTGRSPRRDDDPAARRPALLIDRRGGDDKQPLESTFVTVFEPVRPGVAPIKVGRVAAPPGVVSLYLETADGPEHLVLNARPGTPVKVELADGRTLAADGVATRVRGETVMMAGGTEARLPEILLRQPRRVGEVKASARFATAGSRGWFETDAPVPEFAALAGRTLLIRHGDGTTRGWTLAGVEPVAGGRTRLLVREEPGFLLEGADQSGRYYQFPGNRVPGPHHFSIASIGRAEAGSAARIGGRRPR